MQPLKPGFHIIVLVVPVVPTISLNDSYNWSDYIKIVDHFDRPYRPYRPKSREQANRRHGPDNNLLRERLLKMAEK